MSDAQRSLGAKTGRRCEWSLFHLWIKYTGIASPIIIGTFRVRYLFDIRSRILGGVATLLPRLVYPGRLAVRLRRRCFCLPVALFYSRGNFTFSEYERKAQASFLFRISISSQVNTVSSDTARANVIRKIPTPTNDRGKQYIAATSCLQRCMSVLRVPYGPEVAYSRRAPSIILSPPPPPANRISSGLNPR